MIQTEIPPISHQGLILEIGVGKGRFIREMAIQHPNKTFLGVEKVNKWIHHAEHRLQQAGVSNVHLYCMRAEELLKKIPESSVEAIFVLFPDPWPKRRHYSRRLLQADFFKTIHGLLQTQGQITIVTDHVDYFHWIQKTIRPFVPDIFEINSDVQLPSLSNYHQKYQKEGRMIYSVTLRKV